MAKIAIPDLPQNMTVTADEMKEALGGGLHVMYRINKAQYYHNAPPGQRAVDFYNAGPYGPRHPGTIHNFFGGKTSNDWYNEIKAGYGFGVIRPKYGE